MQTENVPTRLALVIGNSVYDNFPALNNPKNDAEDVIAMLKLLGFAVGDDPSFDLIRNEMLDNLKKFTKRIHKGVTDIVFYYAGHGCSIKGESFLVPIDGFAPEDTSIAKKSYIRLDWLIKRLADERPQDIPIIIILDCCRIKIANDRSTHGEPVKSTVAQHNVFIMYATTNGHVAVDGRESRNGGFTQRLLKYLDTDKNIEEISMGIRNDFDDSNRLQIHWSSSTMKVDYYFRRRIKEHGGMDDNTKDRVEEHGAMDDNTKEHVGLKWHVNTILIIICIILPMILPVHCAWPFAPCSSPILARTNAIDNHKMIKVPYRKNNLFIGRADILETMEQSLNDNHTDDNYSTGQCHTLVLSGLGGMGKTQLMLQYYHTHRSNYKDFFWLNAYGTAAAMDMFRLLAETLNITIDENEKGDRDGMLANRIRWNLEARKDRWLLMLDNVETFSDVSRFIPSMGGNVIVTTRDHVDKREGTVIRVEKMSKDDALLLLVGSEKWNAPSKAALKIIEELDCMPLAIDIVRAYIDRTGDTLESYLKRYKTKNNILLNNRNDTNLDQYKYTIATVWNVSLEKIRDQNKLAELILYICAILQPDTIPVSLFEQQATTLLLGASVESIHDAIGLLVQFSFVQRAIRRDDNSGENEEDGDGGNAGKDIIIIHRLVQAVIRDTRMERNNLLRIYERVIAAFDKEIVSGDCYDPQTQRTYALYLPHIREIVRLVDWRQMDVKFQSILGKLISRTVGHYIAFGQGYQSLHSLANFSLFISEESNGLEHPDTLTSLNNLALLYYNQGKHDEAEPLMKRALVIREKVLGPDHPSTSASLNNLALLYFSHDKYDEAEPLYQRALAIVEKVLGLDHPSISASLNNLAGLLIKQGITG